MLSLVRVGFIRMDVERVLFQMQLVRHTSNSLTDTIPSNYYQLPKIDRLNYLSRSIPNELSFLSTATVIELHDTMINDKVPDIFTKFSRLSKLRLHLTDLNGEIPTGLSDESC